MHDGRFETLEEVLEHYSSGIQYSPTLDVRFRGIGSGNTTVRQMDLTEEEKEGLIAFLHTLTDEEFLRDEKFSDPFIK
jgi:cytochrome c peroxidase